VLLKYPYLSHKNLLHGKVSNGVNANLFFVLALAFVFNQPVNSGKNSIIATYANIVPRVDFGSPLPDDDIPGSNHLPVILLDSQAFGFAVPTVPRTADTFLVSEQLQIYTKHV